MALFMRVSAVFIRIKFGCGFTKFTPSNMRHKLHLLQITYKKSVLPLRQRRFVTCALNYTTSRLLINLENIGN